MTGSLWMPVAIVVAADLILSVTRSAFHGLGMLSRNRALRVTPVVGRWLRRDGLAPASHRLLATLQIAKPALFALLAGTTIRVGAATGIEHPVAVGLLAAVGIEIVLEQGIGRGLAAALGPERSFRLAAPLLLPAYLLLLPITALLPAPGRRPAAGPGSDPGVPGARVPDEEVQEYIDAGREEGILEQEEGRMVRSIVEFGDTLVREVMTPRPSMVAIERTATGGELRRLLAETKHSRIPVYVGDIDRIEGIVHIKELVSCWNEVGEQGSIEPLLRPASRVPETMKVAELLRDFQRQRIQIAIVVDEFGGTAGLVTIEDLVEEIVGEIRDEHESREEPIRAESPGTWLVRGSADIEEVGRRTRVDLDGGEWETVGGLVATLLGRVPSPGESLRHGGLGFEVLEADRKRIHLVRIRRLGAGPVE